VSNDKFWVVWQPESGAPHHRHESFHLAQDEAERLAIRNPRKTFFVLEAISKSSHITVVTTVLGQGDQLPF